MEQRNETLEQILELNSWEYILSIMCPLTRDEVEQWFESVEVNNYKFLDYYCYIYELRNNKKSSLESSYYILNSLKLV